MANYNEMDNRDLLAASVAGDDAATAELTKRGNSVVYIPAVHGGDDVPALEREILGSQLYNPPHIAPDDVVTVTNGKITAVNDESYP